MSERVSEGAKLSSRGYRETSSSFSISASAKSSSIRLKNHLSRPLGGHGFSSHEMNTNSFVVVHPLAFTARCSVISFHLLISLELPLSLREPANCHYDMHRKMNQRFHLQFSITISLFRDRMTCSAIRSHPLALPQLHNLMASPSVPFVRRAIS